MYSHAGTRSSSSLLHQPGCLSLPYSFANPHLFCSSSPHSHVFVLPPQASPALPDSLPFHALLQVYFLRCFFGICCSHRRRNRNGKTPALGPFPLHSPWYWDSAGRRQHPAKGASTRACTSPQLGAFYSITAIKNCPFKSFVLKISILATASADLLVGATAGRIVNSRRVRAYVPAHRTPRLYRARQKLTTVKTKYVTNIKWVSRCTGEKKKSKSFGIFFRDIHGTVRALWGCTDGGEPKPRETADYTGSEESDTCRIMNSDAQRGLYFLTGLRSRKLNCTTRIRRRPQTSYLKAQPHTHHESPAKEQTPGSPPSLLPQPFHGGTRTLRHLLTLQKNTLIMIKSAAVSSVDFCRNFAGERMAGHGSKHAE